MINPILRAFLRTRLVSKYCLLQRARVLESMGVGCWEIHKMFWNILSYISHEVSEDARSCHRHTKAGIREEVPTGHLNTSVIILGF